jgi:general stress protein 26
MAETEHKRQHLAGDEATAQVRSLLGYYRSAMLTTVLGTTVHTRPMGVQGKPENFNGSLWFFTDDRSRKVQEINAGAAVSLIFQSDEADSYLHLFGTATFDNDRTRMKEFYNPLIKAWFPEGLDDPHLTLVRFDVERGDYWTSSAGMLQVLAAFTKSVVTGKPGGGGEMGDMTID